MASHLPNDQTRFSLEEPLFEQMGQLPPEPVPDDLPPKVPLLKQKKFVIGLIAGVTVLVLIILFAINAYIIQQKQVKEPEVPTDSGETGSQANDPLLQRILNAQQTLKEADPSSQELVYPVLDNNIRIDPKVKK